VQMCSNAAEGGIMINVVWSVTYTVYCSFCAATCRETWEGYAGGTIPEPSSALDGWKELSRNQYLCPAHTIQWVVDGQLVHADLKAVVTEMVGRDEASF